MHCDQLPTIMNGNLQADYVDLELPQQAGITPPAIMQLLIVLRRRAGTVIATILLLTALTTSVGLYRPVTFTAAASVVIRPRPAGSQRRT